MDTPFAAHKDWSEEKFNKMIDYIKKENMKFLEQDLEDMICKAIQQREQEQLRSRGLPMQDGVSYRQFDFGGGYGVADIINIYRDRKQEGHHFFNVDIFELKRDTIDYKAIGQACRYHQACVKHYNEIADELPAAHFVDFHIYLVGKSIDNKSDLPFLLDVLEDKVTVLTYEFDAFNGLVFNSESGWHPSGNKNNPFIEYNFPLSAIKQMLRKTL